MAPKPGKSTQKESRQPGGGGKENAMNVVTMVAPDGQADLSFISEGFHTFTAAQANIVLRECHFDGQRAISKDHVAVLADIMKHGKWEDKDKLDFAVLHGRPILVNGYHRMQAQIACGKAIRWTVITHQCRSMEDVRALYFRFDTNTRLRSAQAVLHAMDFGAKVGLLSSTAQALYNAVPIIANKFSFLPKDRDILSGRVIDKRIALASHYVDAAQKLEAAITGAERGFKKKLLSSGVFAVGLATFRDQAVTANEFWRGVALNDGLRRGDPRQTLHNFLRGEVVKGGGYKRDRYIHAPAICWNAYFDGRELQVVRIPETRVVHIAGTEFEE